nr:hypothetical protein [Candidatus Freyarchaeota archaeon]
MNLKYVKIGIILALLGGILGIIGFFGTLLIPADLLASLMPNTLLIILGYLSLLASIIITLLMLCIAAQKLLAHLNTILILGIILGIIELLNISFPYLGLLGGILVIIGIILAKIGLKPEPEPAKPAKTAKRSKAKKAK